MSKKRVDDFKKILKGKNIDAFLVSNFYNIFYLSGFKTLVDNEREAWLLVTKDNEYIFTDQRYSSVIHDIRYVTPEKRLTKHLLEIVRGEDIKTLGFEADDLKFFEYENLKKSVNKVDFVPTNGLVVKQREIKDLDEIQMIKRACQISDECLRGVVKEIKIGVGEKEVAFKLEFYLKKRGYDLAFYPIVAVDENSAIPHYDTRHGDDRKIKNGSVVLIDFGAKYNNYLSDITRMVFVGTPNNEALNQYQSLLDAQTETLKSIKPGVNLKLVDAFCREEMNKKSLPNYSHSTGHGVGLEIHEYPKMSFMSTDLAVRNQVVTVEPGIYIPKKWGMRIEDTVLVTSGGSVALTEFPKDLLVI